MNERRIVTIALVGASAFTVFIVGLVLTILFLRRRCKRKTTNETDARSIATSMTVEDGISNLGIDGETNLGVDGETNLGVDRETNLGMDRDGLVSATRQRVPEPQSTQTELDPRLEQILNDAYADARKFAKFPNMP